MTYQDGTIRNRVPARSGCAAILVGWSMAAPALGHIPCRYEVTILPEINCGLYQAPFTPVAINNQGHVLGIFGSCGGSFLDSCLWTPDNGLMILPRPPGMVGWAVAGMNDNGLIVGEGTTASPHKDRAYIYNLNNGQWTEIPPPFAGGSSWASAVNNSGVVVGARSVGNMTSPFSAFIRYPNGELIDLGVMNGPSSGVSDVNEAGAVVGWTGAPSTLRAFLHENGRTTIFGPVPGAETSNASRINDAGQILMGGLLPGLPITGLVYIYTRGHFAPLLPLDGYTTLQVRGMNEDANVVGNSGNPSVGMTGTGWFSETGIDLNTLLSSLDTFIEYGRDISDDGRILASVTTRDGLAVALLSPVYPQLGDANCDETVDLQDLYQVIAEWGFCPACNADFNGDGAVNVLDLLIVINNWNPAG